MSISIRALRGGFVGLALLAALVGAARAEAEGVTSDETVRSVRKMLERLPYYGVFDSIVFSVNRGTVTFAGYAYEGNLKADAQMAATKRASGIVDAAADR